MAVVLWILQSFLLLHISLAEDFQVNVQNDGQYSISVGGKVWLRSGPAFFNKDGVRWSTDSEFGLMLSNARNITSGGYVTNWVERQFNYTYGNGTDIIMIAIRTFTETDTVIFTQTFISASDNTSFGVQRSANETISGFPSFLVKDPDEPLAFLSFGGSFLGDRNKSQGRFTSHTAFINDGFEAGPLALFNEAGQSIVISPYDSFMSASMWHEGKPTGGSTYEPNGRLSWGIMGGVKNVPANFTYRTIIRYGNSINEAFTLWGESLASQFHTAYDMNSRAGNQSQDVSLNYLGYWTDKGSYYYYHTKPNTTYEDTLKDVAADAVNQSIPYWYLQLDSWWYPKDSSHGVTSWTPMSSVFPHGLKSLSDSTRWKFVAHNRYWSNATDYAKSYNWIVDKTTSLPNDIAFWRFLFRQAKTWGLLVYEQDWLDYQTTHIEELQTSLTLGRDWLMQMGQAAAEQGLTIQYCRALPRHALQSLEIPVVTQARVSVDYLNQGQWQIGITSIFADALGIRPSKDTFWTNLWQPGNPYTNTDATAFPELEAAVATLSMGPVGPSDGTARTAKKVLMKCCRQDGTLLKPNKPAKAIDKQIITDAFHPTSLRIGEVWGTYTDVIMNKTMSNRFGLLLAADISRSMEVTIGDLWFDLPETGIYYPHGNPYMWKYYNSSTTIDLNGCSTYNFCLYHFSPLLPNSAITAILGDTTKWVPMATERVSNVVVGDDTVIMTVTGALGEYVPISYVLFDTMFTANCTIGKLTTTNDCNLIWNTITSRAAHGAVRIDTVILVITACVTLLNFYL